MSAFDDPRVPDHLPPTARPLGRALLRRDLASAAAALPASAEAGLSASQQSRVLTLAVIGLPEVLDAMVEAGFDPNARADQGPGAGPTVFVDLRTDK